jgi:hypothetical protein
LDRTRSADHDLRFDHWADLDFGASGKQQRSSGSAALVAVVQTADFRDFDDVAYARRVDGSWLRGVFAEGEMRSRFVVVGKIRGQDATEMLLTEDDHVIETLSAYGSHKALSIGILPGRPRCCEDLVDADAAHSMAKLVTVDAIEKLPSGSWMPVWWCFDIATVKVVWTFARLASNARQ